MLAGLPMRGYGCGTRLPATEAPLHVDASGAWDGSHGAFASVDIKKGTCVGVYLGDALRKVQADQLSAARKPYTMDALFTGGRPKFKVIDGYMPRLRAPPRRTVTHSRLRRKLNLLLNFLVGQRSYW